MEWATRRAAAVDHAAVARLFLELGVPEPPPDVADFGERMLPRVVVACRGEQVVGFAHWRIYDRTAHVVHVAVAPDARGRGVGAALMEATRQVVIGGEGCTRWYLNVKRDNAPARRLYERYGMTYERELWVMRMDWPRIEALAGECAPARAAEEVGPEEDAELAARFELPRERLASLRARPGAAVLVLRDGGAIAACAVFDPRFPGAAVFHVARAALARPLLDALRARAALARFDFVRIVVDGDPALAAALVAAGAEVTFELLQMGAALP